MPRLSLGLNGLQEEMPNLTFEPLEVLDFLYFETSCRFQGPILLKSFSVKFYRNRPITEPKKRHKTELIGKFQRRVKVYAEVS